GRRRRWTARCGLPAPPAGGGRSRCGRDARPERATSTSGTSKGVPYDACLSVSEPWEERLELRGKTTVHCCTRLEEAMRLRSHEDECRRQLHPAQKTPAGAV